MISKDRLEKALRYIAETDEDLADAKTEVERSSWLCKHTRALVYEMVGGKTVDDRRMAVERHEKVSTAEERRIKAIGVLEHLKSKRESEELVINVWRTLESSRRAGVIT